MTSARGAQYMANGNAKSDSKTVVPFSRRHDLYGTVPYDFRELRLSGDFTTLDRLLRRSLRSIFLKS